MELVSYPVEKRPDGLLQLLFPFMLDISPDMETVPEPAVEKIEEKESEENPSELSIPALEIPDVPVSTVIKATRRRRRSEEYANTLPRDEIDKAIEDLNRMIQSRELSDP